MRSPMRSPVRSTIIFRAANFSDLPGLATRTRMMMVRREDDDVPPHWSKGVHSVAHDVDLESSVLDAGARKQRRELVLCNVDFAVGTFVVRRRWGRGTMVSSGTVVRSSSVLWSVSVSVVRRRRGRSILRSRSGEFVPNPFWERREPTRSTFRSSFVRPFASPFDVGFFPDLVLRKL